MSIKRREVKITIAKLLELAYSKDKELTTNIMMKKGRAKFDDLGTQYLNTSARPKTPKSEEIVIPSIFLELEN